MFLYDARVSRGCKSHVEGFSERARGTTRKNADILVADRARRSLPQEVLHCGRVGACAFGASRRLTTKNNI